MKRIIRSGGGRCRISKEDEAEAVEILLNLSKSRDRSELLSRYSFTWGRKKKRSVSDFKSESSPSPSTQRPTGDSTPENVTAAEPDKSPSTPLSFLPNGSGSDGGSDGGDKQKPPPSVTKIVKLTATDDLVEVYNAMQQERAILIKKIKATETLHQELKAKGQKISYSRTIEDFHKWGNSMKTIDQQHCHHQQIPMLAPATQQLVIDPSNGKLVTVSCSSNSNSGGRIGLLNQIDPRVTIHGEPYQFMAPSHLLHQSNFLVMDDDLRVRTAAAAARKRRILRMKEKNPLVGMKGSRGGCR